MDYLSWNNSIGARFFTPELRDRRVYLYVTADLIREIGKPSGAGMADFLVAVKRGPDWVSYGKVCERADQCVVGWRRRKLQYPPYLAYLGLFALAAGLRGDFAGNAYYPRLRKLLGETLDPKLKHAVANEPAKHGRGLVPFSAIHSFFRRPLEAHTTPKGL